MKNSNINFAIAIILVFSAQFALANSATEMDFDSTMMFTATKSEMTVNTGAFGEVVGMEKGKSVKVSFDSPEYVRRAKVLADDFSGYKIELVTVYNQPLALNDELFQQFGGITYVQNSNNSYTYLLGGNFEDKKAVVQFLEQIVQPNFKNAKAVKFQNGQQVKLK